MPWQPPAGEHLPGNVVKKLLVSRDGTLWIGAGKGLASWKDGKLIQYPEMAGWIVNALVEDHEGTVWAGGFGVPGHGRLCAIKGGRAQCSDPGEGVQSIYEDSKNTLWVSTFKGLWRWKPQSPQFFPTGTTVTSASDRRQVMADCCLAGQPEFSVSLMEKARCIPWGCWRGSPALTHSSGTTTAVCG